ncbi:hypothetical protein [Desulfospira joergensenii]|uniref:hypothetical protein n=1 Tax=Desulfospira joergensenii TaxID=53329 RepID=UPI0003B79382|nr:hypothetical protein [Desulfospira joergensenii]
MDQILSKAEKWIKDKRDPRSARWQAGLEAVMDLYMPGLEKGRLTPVSSLEEKDMAVFKEALARVDLSPGLWAAFLPPCAADLILPPDSVEELIRVDKGTPSYKIIIQRPGKEHRILCAEISAHARRPGIDIFQSGAFLGNFDYESHEICIEELTKAIRAHAWEKGTWQQRDHIAYTLNWFDKTVFLGRADVSVDETRSFFHSPTLIRTDRMDALFRLLTEALIQRFKADPKGLSESLPGRIRDKESREARSSACQSLAETGLLDLLNLVKTLGLIDFAKFTNAESEQFKTEFTRSIRKLSSDIDEIILA